jgi:hypothetical protein
MSDARTRETEPAKSDARAAEKDDCPECHARPALDEPCAHRARIGDEAPKMPKMDDEPQCYMCRAKIARVEEGCTIVIHWSGGISPKNFLRSIRQNLCGPECLRRMLLLLAEQVPFANEPRRDIVEALLEEIARHRNALIRIAETSTSESSRILAREALRS